MSKLFSKTLYWFCETVELIFHKVSSVGFLNGALQSFTHSEGVFYYSLACSFTGTLFVGAGLW